MTSLVLFLMDVAHAVVTAALTVWIVWLRTGALNGLMAAWTILALSTTPWRRNG